jgi:hypothetical protein
MTFSALDFSGPLWPSREGARARVVADARRTRCGPVAGALGQRGPAASTRKRTTPGDLARQHAEG